MRRGGARSDGTRHLLVDAATDIFRNDLDAGSMTVLVEMIAGASSTTDLGAEVAARIGPWKEFAQALRTRPAEHRGSSGTVHRVRAASHSGADPRSV